MGGAMKGRRRDAPGVSDEPPLPELWSPRDLDHRPQDGPATFAMTRVDRPSRRGALPIMAMVVVVAGLVGLGLSGRTTPTPAGRSPAPIESANAAIPTASSHAVADPS